MIEAAEETLRKSEDEIETLRDPSHVKNLSRNEMLELGYRRQEMTGLYPYRTDKGICFNSFQESDF